MTFRSRPTWTIHSGDCLEILRDMPEASVAGFITDPPYALRDFPLRVIVGALLAWLNDKPYDATGKGFMGRDWDKFVPGPELWKECYRVLVPGGPLASFSSTRTWDLMAMAIRLSGFELRDTAAHETLRWYYGTGNPAMKSANVSLLIDNFLGVVRPKRRVEADKARNAASINSGHGIEGGDRPWMQRAIEQGYHEENDPEPVSDEAKRWRGYGTALKPCYEPVLLFRKPLEGTIAQNVLKHGAGVYNIGGCLIGDAQVGWGGANGMTHTHAASSYGGMGAGAARPRIGRWPGNLWVEHHPNCGDECVEGCPHAALDAHGAPDIFPTFRYQPKPSVQEKEAGLAGGPRRKRQRVNAGGLSNDPKYADVPRLNDHETVKSVAFMRWMMRLLVPPGGTICDPFCGSGTSGVAAVLEGYNFVGMELRSHHAENARKRIAYAMEHPEDFEESRKVTALPKPPSGQMALDLGA